MEKTENVSKILHIFCKFCIYIHPSAQINIFKKKKLLKNYLRIKVCISYN